MKYTVQYGQSIFDVALAAYSDASLVYMLIAENPQIDNINSELSGMVLEVTPIRFPDPKEALKLETSFKRAVVIGSKQSLFDIALQYSGSAENVYNFILGNPQLENILSDPTGMTLNYEQDPTYIPEFYRLNGIVVATKPLSETSSEGSFVITEGGLFLIQENGFYILLE